MWWHMPIIQTLEAEARRSRSLSSASYLKRVWATGHSVSVKQSRQARQMARLARMLAAKPENSSSIPEVHDLQIPLWHALVHTPMCTHTVTLAHTGNSVTVTMHWYLAKHLMLSPLCWWGLCSRCLFTFCFSRQETSVWPWLS